MFKKSKEKTNNLNNKLASIGDFVTPNFDNEKKKDDDKYIPKNESLKDEISQEEDIPKFNDLTPDQIKEKILNLVSRIASQGLNEEEKTKFISDFKFWNSTFFEILDISNHLKSVAGETKFTLTPAQSLLIYIAGTGALVILLRPDLQSKVFKKNQELNTEPMEKENEEELVDIRKEAPNIF